MYRPLQSNMPYKTGVGAVEINIYNPTASPGVPGVTPRMLPMPPQQYNNNPPQPNNVSNPNNGMPQDRFVTNKNEQKPVEEAKEPEKNTQVEKKEEQKVQDNKKNEPKKEVTPLTNEYLKLLESYLNNQDADIRLMGAKELLKRFKEDDTRKTDPALTNLLNKSLRDPSQGVRLMALACLDAGYASGNELTDQILVNMQNSRQNKYNQDSVTASKILLKNAGRNLNVQSSSDSGNQQPAKSEVGNNLNIVAK